MQSAGQWGLAQQSELPDAQKYATAQHMAVKAEPASYASGTNVAIPLPQEAVQQPVAPAAAGSSPMARPAPAMDASCQAQPNMAPISNPPLTPQQRGEALLADADWTAQRIEFDTAGVLERLSFGDDDANNSVFFGPGMGKQPKKRPLRAPAQAEPPPGRNASKGLRHFSMKVCEKVESKGRTTYNEVADELVRDFSTPVADGVAFDEKNIRRRVYDALNVLMAIDVIRKEKKDIQWCGLPSGLASPMSDVARLERQRLRATLHRQAAFLQELLSQQRSLQKLVLRNRHAPVEMLHAKAARGGPTPLQLPFIIIQAGHEARVELQLSDDSTEVHFDFHSTPFKIHGDDTLLKLMDLDAPPLLSASKRMRGSSSSSAQAAAAGLGPGSGLPPLPDLQSARSAELQPLVMTPSIVLSPIKSPWKPEVAGAATPGNTEEDLAAMLQAPESLPQLPPQQPAVQSE